MSNGTDQIVRDEMVQATQSFLEKFAESEADFAAIFVDDPEGMRRPIGEKVAGMPAVELAGIVGPIVVPFLSEIARAFLAKFQDKAIEKAADEAVGFLSKRVIGDAVGSKGKSAEDVRDALYQNLLRAGWAKSKAEQAAAELYQHGQSVARKTAERVKKKY